MRIPSLVRRVVSNPRALALAAALSAGVAVAVVALDVALFGHDPLDPATQFPPSRPAVAGTWTLDRAGCVEVGPAVTPGNRPTLVLHDNNTFSARDLPDWWNPDALVIPDKTGPRRAWRLVSGSGRWALQKGPAGWVVTLRFSTPPRLSTELRLYGQNPPHRLGVILGDPDAGRSLTFEKTGTAPPPRRPFVLDAPGRFGSNGVDAVDEGRRQRSGPRCRPMTAARRRSEAENTVAGLGVLNGRGASRVDRRPPRCGRASRAARELL